MKAEHAHLADQVGPNRSTAIDVDEQVDLAAALLENARTFRDLTTEAGQAAVLAAAELAR